MLKWIETTGRSEEDAISAALFQLGLDRDDVSVEVIERAKSGFLGFGSNPAKVRVSYEEVDGKPCPISVEKAPEIKEEPVLTAAKPVVKEKIPAAKAETPKPAPEEPKEEAPAAEETILAAKPGMAPPKPRQSRPERRERPRQENRLKEGDVLNLGNYRFTVLETPGHSLGSIALFEEKEGWLFTGDSMLTWEVWGQLDDSAALSVYGDSMKRLAAMQDRVRTVFPAHWVPDRMPEGRTLSPYELPPEVLTVYAEGIEDTLNGKLEWRDYPFALGAEEPKMMKCTYFSIGGIAFDPARLGRPAKK